MPSWCGSHRRSTAHSQAPMLVVTLGTRLIVPFYSVGRFVLGGHYHYGRVDARMLMGQWAGVQGEQG